MNSKRMSFPRTGNKIEVQIGEHEFFGIYQDGWFWIHSGTGKDEAAASAGFERHKAHGWRIPWRDVEAHEVIA